MMKKEDYKALTKQEIKVLTYINTHYSKKIRFKLDVNKIAEACDLNTMQTKEMLERFKEKKLIKKSNSTFYYIGEAAIELLFEVIGNSI